MEGTAAQHRGWRELERYTYVSRPYDEVWPWLAGHLSALGEGLPDGGRSLELHIRPAGVAVSRKARLGVGGLVCVDGCARASLKWIDAAHPRLFPTLTAVLEIRAVPSDARPFTQIGVQARYRPPLGPLGRVGDQLIGGDVADVAVTNFLEGLADDISDALAAGSAGPGGDVDLAEGGDPTAHRLFLTVDGLAVRRGGAAGVCDELAAIPGVVHVSIDPWNGLVAVDHDPTRCGVEEIAAAVERRAPARSPS